MHNRNSTILIPVRTTHYRAATEPHCTTHPSHCILVQITQQRGVQHPMVADPITRVDTATCGTHRHYSPPTPHTQLAHTTEEPAPPQQSVPPQLPPHILIQQPLLMGTMYIAPNPTPALPARRRTYECGDGYIPIITTQEQIKAETERARLMGGDSNFRPDDIGYFDRTTAPQTQTKINNWHSHGSNSA